MKLPYRVYISQDVYDKERRLSIFEEYKKLIESYNDDLIVLLLPEIVPSDIPMYELGNRIHVMSNADLVIFDQNEEKRNNFSLLEWEACQLFNIDMMFA